MDLTQLANLGEFIGGVAVLVTLIYLATEMRRSRAAAEATSVDAMAAGWNAVNVVMVNNRELTQIFMQGSADPDGLDPVDRARFLGLMHSYINHFETVKRRRDAGTMPDEEWHAHASGFADLMSSRGGEWACSEAAITPGLLAVLRDYKTDRQRFAVLKGEA